MDPNTPQYQRAVTPTVDNGVPHGMSRGKVTGNATTALNAVGNASTIASAPNSARRGSGRNDGGGGSLQNHGSIRGSKLTNHRTVIPSNNSFHGDNTGVTNSKGGGKSGGIADGGVSNNLSSILPRFDLILLTDEIPSDKILFARVRNFPDTLVCFRTPEERQANPERLNLDRRQLDVCPLLEQESRLRLLNYQNNNIRHIRNLENLPNLIFLDMYNNKLSSLEGPVSGIVGLRVLMAGKNRIGNISNLGSLRKLDVLDLHSNDIREIEGLDSLSELRVLNLAGNKISVVKNMHNLQALTELNLRRNSIQVVTELDRLPALQRIFLSHNLISSYTDIASVFNVKFLIELSLDGNPISDPNFAPVEPSGAPNSPMNNSVAVTNKKYRTHLIEQMPSLRHLDLKAVTPEERELIAGLGKGLTKTPSVPVLPNTGSTAELPPLPDAETGVAEVQGSLPLPAAEKSQAESEAEPLAGLSGEMEEPGGNTNKRPSSSGARSASGVALSLAPKEFLSEGSEDTGSATPDPDPSSQGRPSVGAGAGAGGPVAIMNNKLNSIKELNHQHLSLTNMDAESSDEKLLNSPMYRLVTGNQPNATTSQDMCVKLFGPNFGASAPADAHISEVFEFESFANVHGSSEKVLYMQGSVFNEGLPSCSWYVNSNKGKLLGAVTKAYFNKVNLQSLASRASLGGSSGISNNAVASSVWFNMFNFLQNSCRCIKFTQNSLESLQDLYKLSDCLNMMGTAKPSASMALEHLSISHNGVCDVSPDLLRPFAIALFCPNSLITLNDVTISDQERARARSIFHNICYSVIPTGVSNVHHLTQTPAHQREKAPKKDGEAATVISVPIAVSCNTKKGSRNASVQGNTNLQNIQLSTANAIAARRTKMLFDAQFNSAVHDIIRSTVSEMQEYDYE